jgi:hypothetical protein
MKKIFFGLIPSFAIVSFVWVFLLDKIPGQSESMAQILYMPLLTVLFAWLIGILVLKVNNISARVIIVLLLTLLGFSLLYFFESNCNFQRHSNSCYQNKAQATGDITYCRMMGYKDGMDECQKEVALNRGDIHLCEGIASLDVYNFCKKNIGSRQKDLLKIIQ